jgi:lysophospholipase L1-like esterase
MRFTPAAALRSNRLLASVLSIAVLVLFARASITAGQGPAGPSIPGDAPLTWTTERDHQDMLDQLGITALRPGPSGNEQAPNHANTDESKANPFPDLPDPLVLKNGDRVTTPAQWWNARRPEIVEDFEREVFGRVPAHVPDVRWSIASSKDGIVGNVPVRGRQLVGHVENASASSITVDIDLVLVAPANAKGPVPVMMMFRKGSLPPAPGEPPPPRDPWMPPPAPGDDPPAAAQLIAAGWGYAFLDPMSVQADNGAGLTRGIIGLVNRGQRRKPDDWGALRAWAWGAARALDYLESDASVDATRVGIDGVSRFGKAALVTMALEPRFAVVLVASSGEGGAKLHRRNFGEAVENLTGSGEYHWMAGNFLKYGAAESRFGSRNAGDLPVDAHELIALCAPRPTFISYGIPEKGDAKWLDQQGSYMATVAASPVFRLLGAEGLPTTEDYRTAKMPPYNTSLLDGRLAWRQHDGGHTDGPNWKHFIPWAKTQLARTLPVAPPRADLIGPADRAAARSDRNSRLAHEQLLAKAGQGRIDLYFEGDSITRRWGATDYPELLAHWNATFFGWNAADFGWGGDGTQNILWRLEHGELDNVNPKVIVLLAGTNNIGTLAGGDAKIADVTRGVVAVVETCRRKAPGATVVLTAIFPRNDPMGVMPVVRGVNANLARLSDRDHVRFLDVNDRLAGSDGRLLEGMMGDLLHPTVKGYQVWADGLTPILTELLGPKRTTDAAPAPTGDPAAAPGAQAPGR